MIADTLLRDLKHAARLLAREPLFTLTAALSLAIGIGASTAVFTVADGLLLQSAPGVMSPDSLVDIVRRRADRNGGIDEISYPDFLEVRDRVTTVDHVFAYSLQPEEVSLRVDDSAERAFAGFVSPNYFEALGVQAAEGRTFGSDNARPEAGSVAVLSYRFWTRRFNADPSIVGRTVFLNGQSIAIVGVAQERFRGMTVAAPDLWLPTSAIAVANAESAVARLTSRESEWLMVGARLKPPSSRAQASAELASIGAALALEFPVTNRFIPPGLRPGDLTFVWSAEPSSPVPSGLRGVAAGFFALLMVLVLTVLVIACANIAGVLLARSAVRARELAVRAAMGAARRRIVAQLLTETVLLFLLGSASGLVLAQALTSIAARLVASAFPVDLYLPLDHRVVLFALAIALVSALACGLSPALRASRVDLVAVLRDEAAGRMDRLRLRNVFVAAQVAFSILLVIIAGSFMRAVGDVAAIDRGFDGDNVDTASLNLSMAGYSADSGAAFQSELVERVRALPGVQVASIADHAPGPATYSFGALSVPGVEPPAGQPFFYPSWTIVASDYFSTLRMPLLAGRDFTEADNAAAQPVAILGEGAVNRFWPSGDAVGQYVLIHTGDLNAPNPTTTRVQIVGVVSDARPARARGPAPVALYVPLRQRYTPAVTVLARTDGARSVAAELVQLVSSMNPNVAVLAGGPLQRRLNGPIETQLLIASSVAGTVGLVGLVLAAIGVYGVTAYAVARRTREIGIRAALGATRTDLVGMIVRQGMTLVVIGALLGQLLGFAAARVLASSPLAAVSPDPLVFAGAAALIGLVGLAACYLPARRATRIGATAALRHE